MLRSALIVLGGTVAGLVLLVGLSLATIFGFDAWASRGGDALPVMDASPQAAAARDALLAWTERDEQQPCDALLVARDNKQVFAWGNTATRYNTHSVRKSLLSALIGIAIDREFLELDETLGDLGIDETATPLSDLEKTATLRDLLTSRSGVYLRAAGETTGQRDGRPERGDHDPGAYYYYNNWDFNVLGVVFERRAGLTIGEALHQWIALPTDMQDFRPGDVSYASVSSSDFRQFVIWMSARDLLRFGALYLDDGRWAGTQVVPEAWVRESVQPHAIMPQPITNASVEAFGYLWWIDPDGKRYWSLGWGGQSLLVIPEKRIVAVGRNNTGLNPLHYLYLVLTENPDEPPALCHPGTLSVLATITGRAFE